MDFLKDNIVLVGLAMASGLMLILPGFRKASGAAELSVMEAVNLINRQHALVLDVREASEYMTGHIVDAKHIPLSDLPESLDTLKKYQNKPILVNCQRGMRSAKACDILRRAAFTEVYHLRGGIDAWQTAKLPLTKG